MEENLATVKLSRIKQCIESIEKHYKGREEDIELSFEFIIGSFFPDVLQNIKEQMAQNYIAGFNSYITDTAQAEGLKSSNMKGMIEGLEHATHQLQLSLNSLDTCGRSLSDAGFFGWSGETLQQEYKNLEILTNKTKELLNYYKIVLGKREEI